MHAPMPQPVTNGEPAAAAGRAYRYRHVVSFEETNLVGNVYFAKYLSWQGRCREMFLLDHAPGILAELSRSLRLVTLNVDCAYFAELQALDEIEIAMTLAHQRQHRIGLAFEYRLLRSAGADVRPQALAARGSQEVGCMQVTAHGLAPCPVPGELARALDPFR
jgi:enediyne biosynthesis thioesterase